MKKLICTILVACVVLSCSIFACAAEGPAFTPPFKVVHGIYSYDWDVAAEAEAALAEATSNRAADAAKPAGLNFFYSIEPYPPAANCLNRFDRSSSPLTFFYVSDLIHLLPIP